MGNIIQSLWIGDRLSTMEQLSIQSFLTHGHRYILYTFGPVCGVPKGAELEDASQILPASQIFQYSEHKSYAGFSNYFRYKLLLERGGWWIDTDVVCLRPFDFEADYVFATERDPSGREFATSGILKAPPHSKIMEYCWSVCQSKNPSKLVWGETGPSLVHEAVCKFLFWQFARSADTFCPIDPHRWWDAITPGRPLAFLPATYAVHLWNEMWRRMDIDKDEQFAPACLYEMLKRTYLSASSTTAI